MDIEARAVHCFDPTTGDDRSIQLDNRVGAVAPMQTGGVLVALADRLAVLDPRGRVRPPLVEIPHRPGVRLNDGVCDPMGRFWVGQQRSTSPPAQARSTATRAMAASTACSTT